MKYFLSLAHLSITNLRRLGLAHLAIACALFLASCTGDDGRHAKSQQQMLQTSTVIGLANGQSLPIDAREPILPERHVLVVPERQAYTGAYVDFGLNEDDVTLEAIEGFAEMVGKEQALIAFSNYWGLQSFPLHQLQVVKNYGAIPLVFWSPWDRPATNDSRPDKFSLTNILSGQWDAYIDDWVRELAQFNYPVMLAWGIEMNGQWFPWSGYHYGAGKRIGNTEPPLYEGPELYKKCFRYVVDRVREQNAKNVIIVFHVNNTSDPDERWNSMANYYPGSDYVDWLGISSYGQQYSNQSWVSFEESFPRHYKSLVALDSSKPVLVAEWGIGEFPKSGDKGAFIDEAMRRFSTEYVNLKGAIFWHERWQNSDGSYSNLRVNSSKQALEAYRKGVSNPFWLERPMFGQNGRDR